MGNNCTDNSNKSQLFLAEVKKVGVGLHGHDVEFDTPFFDKTLVGRFLAIPALDENFFVDVPSTARWAVGQWIFIEGVGKYPIVNVLGSSLVVKNTAGINGNPTTGAQFLGSRKLWLAEAETTFVNLQLDSVQEALLDVDFEACLQLDLSSAADVGNPVAALNASAVCEPCGTNSLATKKVRCVKVFANIFFKLYTLALPLIRELSANVATYVKNGETVTEPVQDIVWNPNGGDLARRSLPLTNSVDAYVGGKKIYVSVPADYANKFYILSASNSNGAPEFKSFDFKATYRIGTAVAAGTSNVKTLLESALGITLPLTGEIDLGISATRTQAVPGPAVAQVNATVAGIAIASTLNQDNIAHGYKVIALDLSAPSLVFANGNFVLEVAHIPFSYMS